MLKSIQQIFRHFAAHLNGNKVRSTRLAPCSPEILELRSVLSGTSLTENDQLLLELVNRARMDPVAELVRYPELTDINDGLAPGTLTTTPKQPLAPQQLLIDTALSHTQDMLADDYFSHTSPTYGGPSTRAAASGYSGGVGENIAWGGGTGPVREADQVVKRHRSLVLSAPHRRNLMTDSFMEVGIAVRSGVYTTEPPVTSAIVNWNAVMLTESFGYRNVDHYITGVAYSDTVVDDNFYSVGESRPGLTLTATNLQTGTSFSVITGPSGGYALQVPNGAYNMTIEGPSLARTTIGTNLVVNDKNIKLDADVSQITPPVPTPPRDLVLGRAADGAWWTLDPSSTDGSSTIIGRWVTSTPWTQVVTLDFNGDGRTDVLGRSNSGDWWVGFSSTTGQLSSQLVGKWSTATNWSNVMAGDFNGDGKDDIVGRASDGNWWVAVSNGSRLTNVQWGKWSTTVQWTSLQVLDVTGDGKDDIAGRASDGSWWVGRSIGTKFVTESWGRWSTTVNWSDIRVGDFNGDGKDDIAGRNQADGNWWVNKSTGTRFAVESWGRWASTTAWRDIMVADMNQDGKDDLVGRAAGVWWIGTSNGSRFSNVSWGRWSDVAWQDVALVDAEGDGDLDLVGRVDGAWWIGQSNAGKLTNRLLTRWSTTTTWSDVKPVRM